MTHAKRGLKKFGLSCLAAFGLLVFMAPNAYSLTWDENGVEIGANKVFEGTMEAGSEFLLLVTIGKAAVVVHCNNLAIDEGILYAAENKAHATLLLTGCKTLINGVNTPACNPPNNAITMKVRFKPILHSNKVYFLFEPLNGLIKKEKEEETYAVLFTGGEEELCSLPPVSITGPYVMQCYTGALVQETCSTNRERQQVMFAPAALFSSHVLLGNGSVVTLHGEYAFYLNVAGKKWNALL